MKWIFLILSIFSFSNFVQAQGEFMNNSTSIAPKGNSMNVPNISSPTIKAPSIFDKPATKKTTSIMEPNTMEFMNTNKFINPGEEVKEKLNKFEGQDNSKAFRKNEFLGDFKSNGEFVRISYRDFGAIDGDLISVLVNDKVMYARIFLDGTFRGIELGLEKGFNKIDFLALNEGASAPNTAEFRVYDDQGLLVSANQWNLATGFKATIIIVKE